MMAHARAMKMPLAFVGPPILAASRLSWRLDNRPHFARPSVNDGTVLRPLRKTTAQVPPDVVRR
jgi:hypothetical protein